MFKNNIVASYILFSFPAPRKYIKFVKRSPNVVSVTSSLHFCRPHTQAMSDDGATPAELHTAEEASSPEPSAAPAGEPAATIVTGGEEVEEGEATTAVPLDRAESSDKGNDDGFLTADEHDSPPVPPQASASSANPPAIAEPVVSLASKAVSGLKWFGMKAKTEIAGSGHRMKVIKQKIAESMGNASKTIDIDLDKRLAHAREVHADCRVLVTNLKHLGNQTSMFVQAQMGASAVFERVGKNSGSRLRDEFNREHRVFDAIANSALVMASAVSAFHEEIIKFVSTQLEPLWLVQQNYDAVRVEYDVCRVDFEKVKGTNSPKLQAVESRFLDAFNRLQAARAELVAKLDAVDATMVRRPDLLL